MARVSNDFYSLTLHFRFGGERHGNNTRLLICSESAGYMTDLGNRGLLLSGAGTRILVRN